MSHIKEETFKRRNVILKKLEDKVMAYRETKYFKKTRNHHEYMWESNFSK